MVSRKVKSAKKLEVGLNAWRMKHGAKTLDLSEIFRTNRQLFLDLANSSISGRDTRNPDIVRLAQLARRTLRLTPKPSEKHQIHKPGVAIENYFKEARLSISKGKMPEGKTWVFHGIPVASNALLRQSPELRPDYKAIVRSLKQSPATRAELRKKTGVHPNRISSILERLSSKRMIKNKRVKAESRVFFEPHR
jgi:hypothetical protein